MSWYKKANKPVLEFLGHNSYGNLRIGIDGTPYTYYDVSPFFANKIRWMIEKSKIPHEIILQKHLKKFSDPERHKQLNPPKPEPPKPEPSKSEPPKSEPPKKEYTQMELFE